MILAVSIALVLGVLLYVLLIRTQDLPFVEPESPTGHLDERKAAIYENIRDANFEFLMGKLSQQDYQQTKADLQQELNEVNTEIQAVLARQAPDIETVTSAPKQRKEAATGAKAAQTATHSEPLEVTSEALQSLPAHSPVHPGPFVCGNCGASFARPMRFCGECGKPMGEARS